MPGKDRLDVHTISSTHSRVYGHFGHSGHLGLIARKVPRLARVMLVNRHLSSTWPGLIKSTSQINVCSERSAGEDVRVPACPFLCVCVCN